MLNLDPGNVFENVYKVMLEKVRRSGGPILPEDLSGKAIDLWALDVPGMYMQARGEMIYRRFGVKLVPLRDKITRAMRELDAREWECMQDLDEMSPEDQAHNLAYAIAQIYWSRHLEDRMDGKLTVELARQWLNGRLAMDRSDAMARMFGSRQRAAKVEKSPEGDHYQGGLF